MKFCPVCGEEVRPLEGATLGEFRILKVLGAGGFGVVYRAETTEGKVDAAIKVLKPPDCYQQDKVSSLLAEVELMAADLKAAECEQIVGVKTVRREPFPHIVMDYANSGSLQGLLKEQRESMGEEQAAPWISRRLARKLILDIALALEHAHAREVVHRDLKPGNLLLHKKGGIKNIEAGLDQLQCKVVDWGTSSSGASVESPRVLANDELSVGSVFESSTRLLVPEHEQADLDALAQRFYAFTPKYGPPEHYEYQEKIERGEHTASELKEELKDPRGDIFQFGLLAYETLTGEFPFPAYTIDHYRRGVSPLDYWERRYREFKMVRLRDLVNRRDIRQRTGMRYVFPFSHRYSEDAKYVHVIDKCLSKDREERYQDGGDLVKALQKKPLLRDVRTYAAAAVLLIMALTAALFLVSPEPGSAGKNFWQNFVSNSDAPVTFEPSEISIASDEKRYCPVLWVGSLESLAVSAFSYAPPTAYVNTVSSVRLERWSTSEERAGDAENGPRARSIEPEPKAELAPERAAAIAPIDLEGRLELRFDELAKLLIEEELGERTRFSEIFSATISMGEDGSEGEICEFFELRGDASVPELVLEGLDIVSGERRVEYPAFAQALPGPESSPLRVFVPVGKDTRWDLRFAFSLRGDGARSELLFAGGDPLRNRSDQRRAGVFARVGSSPEFELKQKGRMTFEFRLSDPLGGELVVPDPLGERATVHVIVRTKSQAARDEQLQRAVDLRLDSGPRLDVSPDATWKKVRGGVAQLDLVPEPGLRRADCEFFWSLGPLGGRPQDFTTDLRPAGWKTGGAGAAEVSVTLPPSFLAGSSTDGRELFLFARETRLLYPRLDDAVGLTVVDIKNRVVSPDVKPTIESLSVNAENFATRRRAGEFVRASGRFTGFYWRLRSVRDLPGTISLDRSKLESREDLVVEWRSDDLPDWSTRGLSISTAPFSERFMNRPLKLTLRARVETVWTKEETFSVVLDFDPREGETEGFLPFFDKVELSGCEEKQTVFGDGLSTAHVKRCNQLQFVVHSSDPYLAAIGLTVDGSSIKEVRRDDAGGFPPLVYSERGAELSKAEYTVSFSLSDDFGNRRSFTKYVYVHAEPPVIDNQQGLSRSPQGLSSDSSQPVYADRDGDCRVSFTVRDDSGIESLSMVRDDVERTLDFTAGAVLTPETAASLRELSVTVEPTQFGLKAPELERRPTEVTVSFNDVKAIPESFKVTAWDYRPLGGRREFELKVQCRRQEGSARWLGLDWIYIRSGDFYVTRTEIPRWFYERYRRGRGATTGESSRDWTPMTNIAPLEMRRFAEGLQVYLPTREEWEQIPGLTWVQAGIRSDVRKKRDTAEWQTLQAAVNCSLGLADLGGAVDVARQRKPRVLAANDLGDLSREQVDRLFGGVYHLLGNVQEVIEDATSASGYSAYGGSVVHTLEGCICDRVSVPNAAQPTNRGFRLVLYSKNSERAVLGRERRVANSRFLVEKKALPGSRKVGEP